MKCAMFSVQHLLTAILIFVIASCLGSFFKLVVDRYGKNESFIFKSSHCLNCKTNLRWWQNIPIFSFLCLKGKCYFCNSQIDINCLYSELVCAICALILFLLAIVQTSSIFETLLLLFFFIVLIFLSMFDLKHRIVPHLITYIAIVLIIISQCILKQTFLLPLVDLGVAFISMDVLYVFATLIKRFKFDINLLFIPLLIWSVSFFFYQNLYVVIVPIACYFLLYRLNIPLRISIVFWFFLFFLALAQTFKIALLDFSVDNLVTFFAGIGIVYLICEVLFYTVASVFPFGFFDSHDHITPESLTIGGGDITVFALISVFLGYKGAFLVLFIASFLAILSHFTLKFLCKISSCRSWFSTLGSKINSQYVPFVPYLGIACFIIIITKW